MARKLKVYGWCGLRYDMAFKAACRSHGREAPRFHDIQSREIVAAHSQAEVARIAGAKGPWQLFNLCETGNEAEILLATSKPGTIFYKPIAFYTDEWLEDRRAGDKGGA